MENKKKSKSKYSFIVLFLSSFLGLAVGRSLYQYWKHQEIEWLFNTCASAFQSLIVSWFAYRISQISKTSEDIENMLEEMKNSSERES